MENIKTVIITQARIGSTRFPEKVLQKIGTDTMLDLHLKRLKGSRLANAIVVATTFEDGVEKIVDIAEKAGVKVYQGSTNDVLDRFYKAASVEKPDYIVRVTSDCPLIDGGLIDDVIEMVIKNDLDYGANIFKEEFPDGQDIEVFKFSALEIAWEKATLKSDREHVSPYIRRNSSYLQGEIFKSDHYGSTDNYNHIRMTVDEPADLETIRVLVQALGTDLDWTHYTKYIEEYTSQLSNQKIKRNEGYDKSLSND